MRARCERELRVSASGSHRSCACPTTGEAACDLVPSAGEHAASAQGRSRAVASSSARRSNVRSGSSTVGLGLGLGAARRASIENLSG